MEKRNFTELKDGELDNVAGGYGGSAEGLTFLSYDMPVENRFYISQDTKDRMDRVYESVRAEVLLVDAVQHHELSSCRVKYTIMFF